jgi:hypothetical protein
LAQPAQAEIVYTPANVTIGPNQSYALDLNHDGIIDFTIMNQITSTASKFELNLFVQNPGGGNCRRRASRKQWRVPVGLRVLLRLSDHPGATTLYLRPCHHGLVPRNQVRFALGR